MHAAPSMPTHSSGRTFLMAMSLLGVVGLIQIAVIAWRCAFLPAELSPFAALHPKQAETPSVTTAESDEAALTREAEQRLVASLAKPEPAPNRRAALLEARVNEWVSSGRQLRERGNTVAALSRLREAQVFSPGNPVIISEMATTYETMGLVDKAIDQWRRIYEKGGQAGEYYNMAADRLRALQLPDDSAPGKEEALPAPVPLPGALQQMPAEAKPEPPADIFSLGDPAITGDTGASQPARQFKLTVPILARPGNPIDVRNVTIQVYFYDQLKDGSLAETDANVTSAWASAPVDWTKGEPQLLEINYAQPKQKTAQMRERRKYFGYVVRVYYKNRLNASRAEPAKLLTQFPPPATLPTSDLPQ